MLRLPDDGWRYEIDVWRPGSADQPAATLRGDSALEGDDVVPGFALPVPDVFADPLG